MTFLLLSGFAMRNWTCPCRKCRARHVHVAAERKHAACQPAAQKLSQGAITAVFAAACTTPSHFTLISSSNPHRVLSSARSLRPAPPPALSWLGSTSSAWSFTAVGGRCDDSPHHLCAPLLSLPLLSSDGLYLSSERHGRPCWQSRVASPDPLQRNRASPWSRCLLTARIRHPERLVCNSCTLMRS